MTSVPQQLVYIACLIFFAIPSHRWHKWNPTNFTWNILSVQQNVQSSGAREKFVSLQLLPVQICPDWIIEALQSRHPSQVLFWVCGNEPILFVVSKDLITRPLFTTCMKVTSGMSLFTKSVSTMASKKENSNRERSCFRCWRSQIRTWSRTCTFHILPPWLYLGITVHVQSRNKI